MIKQRDSFDRVVIGGGISGAYAALVLASKGCRVLLVEQDQRLLARASLVNQARLHTGMHYPRSILTATEALGYYKKFQARFPAAVRHFTQIYAVARHNSRTSGPSFATFVKRLGTEFHEIDPDKWFHRNTVDRAFVVEEPTFDADVLRSQLATEIAEHPNISLRLSTAAIRGVQTNDSMRLWLSDQTVVDAEGIVIAAYAGTNALRSAMGLGRLPLTFELAEIALGRVGPRLRNTGFTVMDGPFWSLMPFGNTDEVTLTSVGLTPLRRARLEAAFPCQSLRADCEPVKLADCSTCEVGPATTVSHQQKQMARFLKDADEFSPLRSIRTVKAVLAATEVDDARPTLVRQEQDTNVCTVFSGKISTIFDLETQLI